MNIGTTSFQEYQHRLDESGLCDLRAYCERVVPDVSSISDIDSCRARRSESAVVSISALSSVSVSLTAWRQRSGRIAYKMLSGRVRDSASHGLPWLDRLLSNIYARAVWRMMATLQTLWSKMRRYVSSVSAWRGSYIEVSSILHVVKAWPQIWSDKEHRYISPLRGHGWRGADIALSSIFCVVRGCLQMWHGKQYRYVRADDLWRGRSTALSNIWQYRALSVAL